MSDHTVIGIDIGGSKTHGVRVRAGLEEKESFSRSANIASVGLPEATQQLDQLLDELGRAGVDAICVGAAGVDTVEAEQRLFNLLQQRFPEIPVQVVHDTRLVLAAAGLSTGAVGISGTGSAAWGCNAHGDQVRAGGWGYLLGDIGGAYGVTRAALQHVLHRADSGLPADALTVALLESCAADTPGHLLDRFYARSSRKVWARRASVVFDLAVRADSAAVSIVEGAATELIQAMTRVCRRLDMTGPVVLAGGLVVHQPIHEQAIRAGLERAGIGDVRVLLTDPVHGAAALAEQSLAGRALSAPRALTRIDEA